MYIFIRLLHTCSGAYAFIHLNTCIHLYVYIHTLVHINVCIHTYTKENKWIFVSWLPEGKLKVRQRMVHSSSAQLLQDIFGSHLVYDSVHICEKVHKCVYLCVCTYTRIYTINRKKFRWRRCCCCSFILGRGLVSLIHIQNSNT